MDVEYKTMVMYIMGFAKENSTTTTRVWMEDYLKKVFEAAIAQDREERETEPMFKDCRFDNHDNDSGIEIGPIPPDPLAAKLEALAEVWHNGMNVYPLDGGWTVDRVGLKGDTLKYFWGETPLAAVDKALEEVTDAD